jgi:hypothetical protein
MLDLLKRIYRKCFCVPAHHCDECKQAGRLIDLLSDPHVVVAYRGDAATGIPSDRVFGNFGVRGDRGGGFPR